MALSPEDVIKKSFSATHLRRGYDETQVDDFLDEVVVELRRLLAENDGLRTDLGDCRASQGLAGNTDGAAPAAAVGEDDDATEQLQRTRLTAELEGLQAQVNASRIEAEAVETESRDRIAAARAAAEDAESGLTGEASQEVRELRSQLSTCQEARAQAEEWAGELQQRLQSTEQRAGEWEDLAADCEDRVTAAEARVQELETTAAEARARVQELETAARAAAEAPAAARQPGEEASSIIMLAQRLHDQHVAEGESYRDKVVSEADQRGTELQRVGQETYDRLVSEGQTQHDELVQTGQQTHDRLVEQGRAQHEELVRAGEQTRDQLVGEGQSNRDQLVGEAEKQRSSVLDDLGSRQNALTRRIKELQIQEVDLRDRLRAFLTDQLSKIDGDAQG